jgi:hypothetical protein
MECREGVLFLDPGPAGMGLLRFAARIDLVAVKAFDDAELIVAFFNRQVAIGATVR